MRSVFLTAACAAVSISLPVALAAAPADAQEARVGSAQVYRTLLASDLSALLNGMEYASVKKSGDGRFDLETSDGFKYSVELMVCDIEDHPQGCLGVSIFASWTVHPGDETKLLAAVDKFNVEYRIGKAMIVDDTIYAERYVTTDGGVTLQHISEEIGEFEAAMGQLGTMMRDSVGD